MTNETSAESGQVGLSAGLGACPFCGAAAELDTQRGFISFRHGLENATAIYCTDCDADMSLCHSDTPYMSCDDRVATLTAAWNRRAQVDDLASLTGQLAHYLKKHNPDSGLAARAMDYLRRNNLLRSPLRDEAPNAKVEREPGFSGESAPTRS